jgi:hypothetical protein
MSGCRHRQDLTVQYPCSFRFPLHAGGTTRARSRFPSRSGGNLQEGGNCKLRPRDWYETSPPTLLIVPTLRGYLLPDHFVFYEVSFLRDTLHGRTIPRADQNTMASD